MNYIKFYKSRGLYIVISFKILKDMAVYASLDELDLKNRIEPWHYNKIELKRRYRR